MKFKRAFISCDHTGTSLQSLLIEVLKSKSIETFSLEISPNEDYTDAAKKVASIICKNPEYLGILICGSGVGVSIVSNRFKNVRAALCHSLEIAELSRKHNNANILCLGTRILPPEEQSKILLTFLNTEFEGGRHLTRIEKID